MNCFWLFLLKPLALVAKASKSTERADYTAPLGTNPTTRRIFTHNLLNLAAELQTDMRRPKLRLPATRIRPILLFGRLSSKFRMIAGRDYLLLPQSIFDDHPQYTLPSSKSFTSVYLLEKTPISIYRTQSATNSRKELRTDTQ